MLATMRCSLTCRLDVQCFSEDTHHANHRTAELSLIANRVSLFGSNPRRSPGAMLLCPKSNIERGCCTYAGPGVLHQAHERRPAAGGAHREGRPERGERAGGARGGDAGARGGLLRAQPAHAAVRGSSKYLHEATGNAGIHGAAMLSQWQRQRVTMLLRDIGAVVTQHDHKHDRMLTSARLALLPLLRPGFDGNQSG